MYLISLKFDKDSTEKLNNYIKAIQEKTKNDYMTNRNIPVHLTIATIHDRDENMMIDKLNEIIENLNEGYIDVVSIGIFSKNTIYLSPVLNKYLFDMSFQINEVIDTLDKNRKHNRYRPYQWFPHITIARKLNEKELNIAFNSLNHIFQPLQMKITHITLSKSQPYQDIYVWKLKGEKNI